MGKQVGIKQRGSDEDKQPGCIWGLVHVLDYHSWHSNVKRIRRYQHHHGDGSPETSIYENEAYEPQRLLDEQQSLHQRTKRSKKRSLTARVKAMIAHDISKEKTKPNLQRTYSIHRSESIVDKISTKNPIIFLPNDDEDTSSQTKAPNNDPDVFDIFKVDNKALLLKHLQHSDKSIASFSKPTFSKSRSFPASEQGRGRKLKPVKIESKQKEVWSFPKENKLSKTERVGGEDGATKRRHLRSSSLNESLDKYARLFDNKSGKYAKLNSSRSLKLKNEYGIAPLYFTRMQSLSYFDSYYADLNLEGLVDNPSGNAYVVSDKHDQIKEDCEEDPQIYQDLEHGCGVDELSCSTATNDLEDSKLLSTRITLDLESDDMSIKIANSENDTYPNKKKSDLEYVRELVEQSGIAVDASEIAWHSSNELLGPQLFEEAEARWPHTRGELTGCPDFYGCWHHQMLFDLVNEVLLEVYDVSFPYYPKPLSSCCHVRPFPIGDDIAEEVCRGVGRLVDMKEEENESLDDIVDRDMDYDRRWMNLQMESEFVGVDIEDMIFEELVQEIVFS